MNKRTAGLHGSATIILIAGLLVAGTFAAAAVAGRGSTSVPEPSAPPSTPPVVTPPPVVPIRIDLDTLTAHEVSVEIIDRSGRLVSAKTGTPTASAAVAPGTIEVMSLNATTLQLTWVDRPGDNALTLTIDEPASRFVLVQPEHDLDGDAIVHDRVLILTFRDPIAADEVDALLHTEAVLPA